MGVASFIFSIVGIFAPLSIIWGIIAVILGAICFNKTGAQKGLGITGFVIGVIEIIGTFAGVFD